MSNESVASALARWAGSRLQRKFLIILIAVLATVSLAFLVMLIWIYQMQLIKERASASMQVNTLLQASLENAMLKRDIDGLNDIIDRLQKQDNIDRVSILNPEFEVRFSSDKLLIGSRMETDRIRSASNTARIDTGLIRGADGADIIRSINPVPNRKPCEVCHGAVAGHPVNGLLIVDYNADGIRFEALKSASMLGLLGSVVILASGLGLWMAVRRLVLSRLGDLQSASNQLAAGKLGARARPTGHDEIAGLSTSFNAMADELQKTIGKVHAAEEFLQAIIDSIPDGVRVIDDNFIILKANQAYCRQQGRGIDKVIGSKCYKCSHDREEPCPETLVTCPVVELRNGASSRLKARHRHVSEDGSDLYVEVSAAHVDLPVNSGKIPCVVESIRDLAEQVKISQEQRLSEIGLLATGVAHEIHNPLSSIELALTAIVESAHEESDGGKQYLDIAREQIAKCLKITEDLMRLSSPPHNGFELVQLDLIVVDVMALLSFQMKQENIEVNIELDEGLRVFASDSDMRMIVINLAQNAIHAMPEGGRLTIAGKHRDGNVEIAFSDTGIGISRSHLEKIFLPFWTNRGDGSDGRGLGLSICKAIIDRSGGTISVDSCLGRGTTFLITLPCADA